jgi:predicted glycoside hydrolase/deacetylase ChbG (UPF0249 family)
MKWLIVTGDDFGMTSGINRGIVDAHRDGILTSASVLVNRPASDEAAVVKAELPGLSLGLHMELNADEPDRVPAAILQQLARFVEIVGIGPTHLDSHHDVHHDPRVLNHVLASARRAGIPVRGHSPVRHLWKFYGQWGGVTHREQIGVEGLIRLLDTEVGDGVTELTCHPGYVHPTLSSSYAAEREIELLTLRDPRIRQAIRDRDIRLVGFRYLSTLVAESLGVR